MLLWFPCQSTGCQCAYSKVKAKLEKVNDYEAAGKMKTNVTFKSPGGNRKTLF